MLDLFCGAGGFSEGFRQAGYQIIAGIDNDPEALYTFSLNFPEALAVDKDLSTSLNGSGQTIEDLFKKKIDVIIGGPPCQGFSIAGKRLKDDPRNVLYKAYLEVIVRLKPSAVVVENVPTIISLFGGEIARQIKQDFEEFGYTVYQFTITASNYGVPQNRKRTFFVGIKGSGRFEMNLLRVSKNTVSTYMAISDLPLLEKEFGGEELDYLCPAFNEYQRIMRSGCKKIYNHWAVVHTEKTKSIIKLVPDGGNYKDLPKHYRDTRRVNIAWTRMDSRKPCFTIDAGHNHHFHYKANRVPTVRECARIQSFPDKFRFFGKKTNQFKQVGNAVPPLLAKKVAVALKRALK
ncbi:MAG: DNA cytosine methyltransferase [bacterium]